MSEYTGYRTDPTIRRRYHREYYRKNLAAKPLWTKERKDTPSATVHPTTLDIAWAAGFFEGDGSVRRNTSKTRTSSALVEVSQCNIEPLQTLQTFFGGRISKKQMGPRNRQQPYGWRISGARAHGFIMTIYPFLSAKRQNQCRAALKVVGYAND